VATDKRIPKGKVPLAKEKFDAILGLINFNLNKL
jgi:hypothetical protein